MSRHDVPGTVYLLHFAEPFWHARHYLGWTEDLAARVDRHFAGNGSPLVAAVRAAGIEVEVVRTWPGTRRLERELHRRHNSPAQLCPICRPRELGRGQQVGGGPSQRTGSPGKGRPVAPPMTPGGGG